jgi:streptogramin lyase
MALLLAAILLAHSADIYVSGFFASNIQRAGAVYAAHVARRPWGLAFGPDGNLYVANFGTGTEAIVRVQGPFSATAGAVSTFVDSGAFFDVAFGPDGNLYAAGHGPVVRYDIVNGAAVGDFTHGHDLTEVHAIAFGDDGYLYVANDKEIDRFDAISGDFVDVYLTRSTVLWDIAFGPDGALFIADSGGSILRFDRPCGRVRSVRGPMNATFATHANMNPLAIAFGPDGNLYVSSSDSSGSAGSILRFNARTGAFIDVFVAAVDGGPRGMAFAIGPD